MDKNLHDIDALFTENLEGETAQPSGHVWDAIEAGLNQRDLKAMQGKNKRLKWLSALLVILLATSLVWLYQTHSKQSAGTASSTGDTITAPSAIDTKAINTKLPADTQRIATAPSNQLNQATQPSTDTPSDPSHNITTTTLAQNPTNPSDQQGGKDQSNPSSNKPESSATNIIVKSVKPRLPIGAQNPLTVQHPTNNKVNKPQRLTAQPTNGALSNPTTTDAPNLQADKPIAAGQKSPNKTGKRLRTAITPASAATEDEAIATVNEDATGYTLPPVVQGPIEKLNKPALSARMDIQSTAGPQISRQLPKPSGNNKLSFSIAPYYAINWFTAKVKNGRPQHREDNRNEIKQREQPGSRSSEASYGMLVTASFNDRWALQTGLGLVSIDNNINSHTLYARQQQAPGGGGPSQGAGFKFNCTAGTVYFNSKLINANPNVGDSLVALQSSSRLQYLQVPLSLRYTFIKKGALQLYGIAGTTANLLTKGQVKATISNGSIKENVSANSIDGLSKMYWGLHVGAGLEYKVGKRWGIYLSPTYSVGITPINKETPVSTRLGQLSLMGGLRLRLGK